MYDRYIDLDSILKRKSLFLFGPRQTGKSTLLKTRYPRALFINLLMSREYRTFQKNPERLDEVIRYHLEEGRQPLIIIDEIQKIPELLDDVHDQIEKNKQLRFILTGSSARKLKREGVNLLGGRATWIRFHPLCFLEMGAKREQLWFQSLLQGSLPSIIDSAAPFDDLADYVGLYLKEEVLAEGLSRSIQNFSRFLDSAALTNAEQLNFTKIGNDAQLSPSTVRDYYQVLQDTLVGDQLPAFLQTTKRKAMATAKFYLFDCGVSNALLNRKDLAKGTTEYGKMLEQAIFLELRAYLDYHQSSSKLEYWRSTSQLEVDFLVYNSLKDLIGIEVKASANPTKKDYRGFVALEEEHHLVRKIVVCDTDRPRKTADGVEILPILHFLEHLWKGAILKL